MKTHNRLKLPQYKDLSGASLLCRCTLLKLVRLASRDGFDGQAIGVTKVHVTSRARVPIASINGVATVIS